MKNQIFKINTLMLTALITVLSVGILIFPYPAQATETDNTSTTPAVVTTTSTTDTDSNTSSTEDNTDLNTEIVQDETTSSSAYTVMVDYIGDTIFSGAVSPTSTWFYDLSGNLYQNNNITALGILAQAGRDGNFAVDIQNFGWGYYVSALAGHMPIGFDGWVYNVNQADPGYVGINDYKLTPNDLLTVFYSVWPWKIEADATTVNSGENITLTAYQYVSSSWQIAPSTTIAINNIEYLTNDQGQYYFATTTTGTFSTYIYGTSDWPQNSPALTLVVTSSPEITQIDPVQNNLPTAPNGSNYTPTYNNINIEKAVAYLNSQQTNGDFGSILFTDWAALALSAYDKNSDLAGQIKQYLLTNPESAGGLNSVSDAARRALALMSLGINPYSGTATDYVQKIINSYDGTQLGDPNLYNDDIFALMVLANSGYHRGDAIIDNTVNFILSKEQNNFLDGIDMTAAAIQVISPLADSDSLKNSLDSDLDKLIAYQTDNGSFDNNPYSTAWAIQAGIARGQTNADWLKRAQNYLAGQQLSNGSIANDVWATAQAIPAGINKAWPQLLTPFTRPVITPTPVNFNYDSITTTTITSTTTTETTSTTTVITPTASTTLITTTTITIATTTLNNFSIQSNSTDTLAIKIKPPLITPQKTQASTNTTTATAIAAAGTPPNQPIIAGEKISAPDLKTSSADNFAKKILAISGIGSLTLGGYLGLKLLQNLL